MAKDLSEIMNDPAYKDLFFMLGSTQDGGDYEQGDSEEGKEYGGD